MTRSTAEITEPFYAEAILKRRKNRGTGALAPQTTNRGRFVFAGGAGALGCTGCSAKWSSALRQIGQAISTRALRRCTSILATNP